MKKYIKDLAFVLGINAGDFIKAIESARVSVVNYIITLRRAHKLLKYPKKKRRGKLWKGYRKN